MGVIELPKDICETGMDSDGIGTGDPVSGGSRIMPTSRRTTPWWCAILLVGVLAGCNKGKSLVQEATRAYESGDLERAIATLERVEVVAPGSPEVQTARALAATWLIATSDKKGDSAAAQMPLLMRALKFAPTSGPAQARICVVLAGQADWANLRKCLDDDLRGKSDIPSDLLAPVRAKLVAHDEQQERTALAASAKYEDWKSLVAKYPQSAEAAQVKDKIDKHESICRDFPAYGFVEYLLPLDDFVKGIVAYMDEAQGGNKKLADLGITLLDKRVRKLKGEIDAKCQVFSDHAIRAGEESVKAELVENCKALSALYGKWISTMDSFDDLAPFVPLKNEGVALAKRVGGVKRNKTCLDLLMPAAPSTSTSAAVVPAAMSK